ncbi:hypothetical protein ILUMI_09972 [Ignelater luminosus]|uniref:Uncharacterized protein n=1 Tax=Ignelater luminosus TaxID=2038154 RepID=A0A8K0CYS2_IGNLU|nr:hypothetical protein ILUMI_09972 [Ignelater luminosus]
MRVDLTNLTYSRGLCFGVPLEDVFPSGEIHPSLKDLIFETYKNIIKNCYDVEYVLSRLQGSLQERLKLKQKLALCQEIAKLKVSPGAPLWVLRHFLGLLPLPLLPQYTNGRKYAWRNLSTACKISLTDYVTRGRKNYDLITKLAQELLHLPTENFLLAATLFNFLRMMSVLPEGEPKINKNTVFALVKYFSSSLFLRPFRPGWVTRIDKQYYPLLLYLILKWPEIRNVCVEKNKYSFEFPLEEIYPGYRKTLQPPECPYYLSKRSNNNATQTVPLFLQEEISDSNNEESLIRIVPPSYNDFSYLKDIGCQTEGSISENKENLTKINFSTPKQSEGGVETQVIFLRKDCCCTYSSNYEKYDGCEQNRDTDNHTDQFKSPENTLKYGWDLSEILDSKSASSMCSPTSEFTNSGNYSYDNYSKFNLMSDTEETNFVYEKIKLFDPVEKEEKRNHNEALKERISKVGWTYSSPIKDKNPCEGISEISPKNYPEPKADQYRLYYEARKSLNEELKEKLNQLKIKEESDVEVSICEDLERSSSRLNLSENVCESRRSVISVSKIRSKLDFLKVFNAKKAKARKSVSCDQMTSRVKYEKMGSISSIL